MAKINWGELFPNNLSVGIFLGYMSLFIAQGILVTASQESNNGYSYNTVTVVLLTEILKLIISICLYRRDYRHSFTSLVVNVVKGRSVLVLYFVPSFLYCLYNNLAFVNLSAFDPTTYYLLLQFRVVITGILFQVIFKKYLSKKQWISLVILTIGCMIKQLNFDHKSIDEKTANLIGQNDGNNIENNSQINNNNITSINNEFFNFSLNLNALFILIQTICSCLAGVYNEYLLKNQGADVNIYVQNVFMYLDSIICNVLVLIIQGDFLDAFTVQSLSSIFRLNVILIMINNAAIGIVTSFFLKYMNSILKTFASALELMFTAVLCWILFAIPIYLNTILAICVVSFAIYLYTQNPVNNTAPTTKISTTKNIDDGTSQKLLSFDNYNSEAEEV